MQCRVAFRNGRDDGVSSGGGESGNLMIRARQQFCTTGLDMWFRLGEGNG